MGRTLTVTRAAIPATDEARYLEACRREAARVRATGDHYWLFRHEDQPGVFLEFRESGNRERLRAADPSAELWHAVELP